MTRRLILIGLIVMGSTVGSSEVTQAASSHRLGPGAERIVARCVGMEQPQLTDDVRLEAVHVERDRVRLEVTSSTGDATLSLFAPDEPRPGLRRTSAATIQSPPELPGEALDALASRLDACGPKIPFVREIDPIDAELRARGAKELGLRVQRRLGRMDGVVSDSWRFSGDLEEAHRAVLAGRHQEALTFLKPLLQSATPPRGGISLWLAANGTVEVCERRQRCRVREVLTDLLDGHLHGEWTARWSQEPRLLLLAAERSASLGDVHRARAYLLAALASDLGDQAAIDRAVQWGWGPGSSVEGLPSRGGLSQGEPTGGSDAPLLALAALLFGLAWWGARAPRAALSLVALGVVSGLVVALLLPGQGRDGADPTWEMPSEAQMTWGRGAGCELGWPTLMDGALYAPMSCDQETMGVMVRLEDERLQISVMPQAGNGALSEVTERWKRAVEHTDESALSSRLAKVDAPEPGLGNMASRLARLEAHQLSAIHATGPVAALAAFALLGLLFMSIRALFERARGDRGARWRLLSALLLAMVAHVAAPSAMVMVYGGYGQVSELVGWQPLRYGAGANWLYGPWLELFGYDHSVIQGVNRLYGLMTLVFLSAWSERMVEATGGYVALALALSPILWRDHASESILVGGMMMLSAGLWGLARTQNGQIGSALLALPCLALAAMTRPEFALFSIPLVAITGLQLKGRVHLARDDWRGLAMGITATLLLAPATMTYLEASTRWMVETGALPGLESLSSRLLGDAANPLRAFADLAQWTPWATLPLALLAAFGSRSRALGIGSLLVALAWMAFTRVDLPAVSIPRVHAPVCALLVVAAGVGLGGLWRHVQSRSWGRGAKVGPVLLLALWWSAEVVPIASALYEPTNADSEERLVRDAQEKITGRGVCLATLDSRDAPARGKTPRMWPSYLFTGRNDPVRILGLGEVETATTVCAGDIYALLGVRCYMALRDEESETPPPQGSPMLESCAAFRERWSLETVLERRVENHGDVAYPMYPQGSHLTIGLYRVLRGAKAGAPDREDRRSPRR